MLWDCDVRFIIECGDVHGMWNGAPRCGELWCDVKCGVMSVYVKCGAMWNVAVSDMVSDRNAKCV